MKFNNILSALKNTFYFSFYIFFVFSSFVYASSGAELKLRSHTYSEPSSIKRLVNSFEGASIDTGRNAFTHNRAQAAYRYNGFFVGVIARYDYWIGLSQDTLQTVFEIENELPIGSDITRDIFLSVNHNQSKGVSLGYMWQLFDKLKIKPTLSAYQSNAILLGKLNGALLVDADSNINGELNLNYIYDEDLVFDREPQEFDGKGLSLDLDIHWQITQELLLSYQLLDGYNQFTFDRATFTEAALNSNTIRLDDNGVVDVNPALIGFEGEKDVTQSLPSKSFLHVKYKPYKYFSFDLKRERFGAQVFFQGGGTLHLGPFAASARYQPKGEAYVLDVRYRGFSFSLIADNSDYSQARILGLNIHLQY